MIRKTPRIPIPPDVKAALAASKKARDRFMDFPPSHQREYLKWIESARKQETRLSRIQKMLKKLAVGIPGR